MPSIPPAEIEILVRANLANLPHGERGAAVSDLMTRTGLSRAAIYRHMNSVSVRPVRRLRNDSGHHALRPEEAAIISAWVMDGLRKNGKRLRSIGQALQELRYAGKVKAERVCPDTGVVQQISSTAVSAALRKQGLHPDQLTRPAPAVALRSLHPNHVWEIDASLCVLYYLGNLSGLQVLDADKFYKNKPKALERVESERVWRYLCVDHYSGYIFCWYVQGAESGANLVEAFIQAVSERTVQGEPDAFRGVPLIAYVDPGSANTGALFKNLARRLQMQVLVHKAGNARATGSVERPQDIWEHVFEASLRAETVNGLDDLNTAALVFGRWFNATATHTRHGRTRTDLWLSIAPEHLRVAPPREMLRQLATHQPEPRKVEPWPGPVIRFAGRVYDVSSVPGVMIGEKLLVSYSPYQPGHACIVERDADGAEVLRAVPEVEFNDAGFRADANVIGEDYRQPADTVLETNRKAVERLAMGADTDAEAAARRKARMPAFGGEVRPLTQAREAVLPVPLQRPGTAIATTTRVAGVEPQVLSHFEAAKALLAQGVAMSPKLLATLKSLHPAGVPETEIADLAARLTVRAGLRLVAGGEG